MSVEQKQDQKINHTTTSDPENKNTMDNQIDDTQKLVVPYIPERVEQVNKILEKAREMPADNQINKLAQNGELENFIGLNLATEREILVRTTKELCIQIGFKKKNTKILIEALESETPIRDGRKDDVLNALGKLQKHLDISQPSSLETLADIGLNIYPRLKRKPQKEVSNIIRNAVLDTNSENHILAADTWASWLVNTKENGFSGTLDPGEEIDFKNYGRKSKFLETFFPLMAPEEFDTYGQFLLHATDKEESKQTLESLLSNYKDILNPTLQKMPISVLNGMTESFVEAGVITKSASGIIRQTSKADETSLTYDYLLQVTRAQKRIEKINAIYINTHEPIRNLEDIVQVYQKHNEAKPMTELSIEIKGKSLRTLRIAGIGLGHQDTAVDFISNLVKRVKNMPEDKKPQVIVINNLLAGAFENRQKNLKPALVEGLRTMEKQFSAGRVVLDELQSLKIPIYLNLGSPDWEIARDIVLRMLRYQFQLVGHVSYYEQDELQRLQEWSKYDKFVVDVALPYCLRKGEVLSAPHLLILLDVYDKLVEAKHLGQRPNITAYEQSIVDINNIPFPGKIDFGDNLFILDSTALSLGNKKYSQRAVYFGDFNLSNSTQPPLYQEPMKSLTTRVIQSLAAGKIKPGDSYTLLNQHEFIALALDGQGTWVESMPGTQEDTFLVNRASRNRQLDNSRRQATTRRRLATVETPIVETKPYRRLYHFMNDELMDLAGSADRTSIIMNGDEQIGSVTARPDLMIKAWDIATEKLKENKIIWGHFGDESHGNNYKEKIQQEVAVGMQASLDHQVLTTNILLTLAFNHVSEEYMKNIVDLLLFPGNHQLNSGFGRYGTTYMDSLAQTWNDIARQKHSPLRASLSNNVVTGDGSFYQGWVGNLQVGGYKGIAQHYPLKKGGKGMNGLPIYQSWPLLESFVENAAGINFFHFQHYHQSSIHLVAGKIATIGPSKAGQSEFEHYLGHRSTPGMMMYHLGGGLPPAVEFLSSQALLYHKISDENYFSDKNLRDLGFTTDKNFSPIRDGFIPWVAPFSAETLLHGMPERHPQSALQKYLWALATNIPLQAHTTIG